MGIARQKEPLATTPERVAFKYVLRI